MIVTTAVDFPIPRTSESEMKTISQIKLGTVAPKNTYIHKSLKLPWESTTTDPVTAVIFTDARGKTWRQSVDGKTSLLPGRMRVRIQLLWQKYRPFAKKTHHAMFVATPGPDFDYEAHQWPPYQERMEDADDLPQVSMQDFADERVYLPEDGRTITLPLAPEGVTFDVSSRSVHGLPGMPLFKLGYDVEGRIVELVILNVQDQFSTATLRKLSAKWLEHTLDGQRHGLLVLDDRVIQTDPRAHGVFALESTTGAGIIGHARYVPDGELVGITFNNIDKVFHPAFLTGIDRG
ncbi:hypothetical protein [Arthrobacter sp. GAS37]|uniref:hypothetical protein n=1 Tax=Arthrobacter sp. GAS37 TaxID=3156261 RepID=UPI00384C440B